MKRSTRRAFIQASGATLAGVGLARALTHAQAAEAFDVSEKSIGDLQAAMTAGRVTSEKLVELYLARIAAYDQAGPRLNSVISINPNAAAAARELDEERRSRGARGPLHGIPVLLKDNFETRDMPPPVDRLRCAESCRRVMRFRSPGCARPAPLSWAK